MIFLFFKQKTAYELRISDWSSDVCSSDLAPATSDPVDDEVMHLDGYEIGSKRILAEIEEHAFDDPPAAPRPSRPFTVSADVRRPIAALESDTPALPLPLADIDLRLRPLPRRTYLLLQRLGRQTLLALLP